MEQNIADRIKELRIKAGISQSELARKLQVTRSSVNAWEMGISTPTAQYIVLMAKLFHVTTDYMLLLSNEHTIVLDDYTQEEYNLVYSIIEYIDKKKK